MKIKDIPQASLSELAEERAALKNLLILKARENFYTFVQIFAPEIIAGFVDGKHIKLICDTLQMVYETDDARVMIWLPPGAMKSKLGSELFPAWCFGKKPTWQILHLGYSADFTAGFGGNIRDYINHDSYKEIFPDTTVNLKNSARDFWKTTDGGVYRSAGLDSAIAGKRGNLVVVDDLLSEQTAYSPSVLKKIQEWWAQGLESRQLPGAKIVVVNTRWGTEDLSGWLLERSKKYRALDKWKVIKVPAILDAEAAKLVGNPEGGSYWPEFYNLNTLEKRRIGMPKAHWLALYQQEPVALDGNVIKTEFFQELTKSIRTKVEYVIASLDTAFSTSTTADYSVMQIWGVFNQIRTDSEGNEHSIKCMALLDQERGRWEYPELLAKCATLERDYVPDIWVIEKKASGQSLIQDLRRRGYFINEHCPDKDKLSRAYACTPFIEDERIFIPFDYVWAQDFLFECKSFSGKKGDKDDQVDSMTQAILYLRDNHTLNYKGEKSLEELEDERESRNSTKRFYW